MARIALDLFAEHHFASVSIRDIGRAAGVNSAMIYYYFGSKEDLFVAAIKNAVDEAFGLYEKHRGPEKYGNAAEAIGAWFDVHVILYKRLRNVVKISIDVNGLDAALPEASAQVRRFYRHENEILRKFILDGMEKGTFRKADPAPIATMISTSLDGAMARSFILDDFDLPGTVEEFKRAILLHLGYEAEVSSAPRSRHSR